LEEVGVERLQNEIIARSLSDNINGIIIITRRRIQRRPFAGSSENYFRVVGYAHRKTVRLPSLREPNHGGLRFRDSPKRGFQYKYSKVSFVRSVNRIDFDRGRFP